MQQNEIISILITSEKSHNVIKTLLSELNIPYIFVGDSHGSVAPSLLSFLNFKKDNKCIFFIKTTENTTTKLKHLISIRKYFEKQNSGIMFSLMEGKMAKQNQKVMLVAIVNYGYSSTVMQIARESGASGGTIFSGRGTGEKEDNFMGITLSSDKEIVLSLIDKEIEKNIIRNLNAHLSKTKISGIVFTLPASNFIGINTKQ